MALRRPAPRGSLLLIGLLAQAVAAAAGDPALRTDPVSAAVRGRLAAGDRRLEVIVHLAAPQVARSPLAAADRSGESARMAAIAPLLERELGALLAELGPADVEVRRRMRLQPAFAASVSRAGLERLARRPGVTLIELDLLWRVHTEEGLPLIGATTLRELGYSGQGTAVAIIDTGIDPLHPALGGRTLPNAKVVRGLDTGDNDADPTDCGGHGTAVAAVAAGASYLWNPQLWFAGGVAPKAKILAYKASSDQECGTFALSAVVAAIEDALLHRTGEGYQLAAINISAGSGAFEGPCDDLSASYRMAVADALAAGVAVVASAGNQGEPGAIAAPACLSGVISVASVWDADSGWSGSSFCLDPGCTAQCSDAFRPAKTVTCYSNSAPTLDLLAPSEYLVSAAARGRTTEFGGTSGAAAYVTGSIALLREARPDLSPDGVRGLLQLTGERLLDRRTGRVRPLVDLARAVANPRVVTAAPRLAVAGDGGAVASSTLWLAERGAIGSLRIALRLVHDRPELVTVTLQAPDGSRIRLHDRGPGNLATGDGAAGGRGVWGFYPDELVPVDSLGALSGHEMAGAWILEVSATGGLGTLVDWGLEVGRWADPEPVRGDTISVPVVARRPGPNLGTWQSGLRLLNPSPARSAAVRLHLVPSGADGTRESGQAELFLPPGTALEVPDLVRTVFGPEHPGGHLLLSSVAQRVLATSWTALVDPAGGGRGDVVGTVTADTPSLALGEPPLVLLDLERSRNIRTNLGISEVAGRAVTVSVALHDGDLGASVGSERQYAVPPLSHLQVRLPLDSDHHNLYATVSAVEGSGRVVAYAARVDNVTQDATFIAGDRPVPAAQLMVPVVARNIGASGSRWRSDLRVANLGAAPARIELQLRPRSGQPGGVHTVAAEIPSGRVLAVQDVVLNLFGLEQAVGSLRVAAVDGPAPLMATARTYTWSGAGVLGQQVAGVRDGLRGRAAILPPRAGDAPRTNLGVCEVAGHELTVGYSVIDRLGRPVVPRRRLTLAPFQLVQITDVLGGAGEPPSAELWIELTADSGGGRYLAYASVVDRVTGDPCYTTAQPISD